MTAVNNYTDQTANYTGELFRIGQGSTPLLTLLGGLTGGRTVGSRTFSMGVDYTATHSSQSSVTEAQAAAGVDASVTTTTQEPQVIQLAERIVNTSYLRQSDTGTLSGVSALGDVVIDDPHAFQIAAKLKEIAREIEWHFWNGTYNVADDSTEAYQMRGLLNGISTNSVDASSASISKAMFDSAIKAILDNSGSIDNLVIFANDLIPSINDLFGHAPQDRTIGGVTLDTVYTSYGNAALMYSPDIESGTIAIADTSVMAPVFLPVNGISVISEDLAKTGAAIKSHLYTQYSLSYGTEKRHAKIINAVA